MSDTFCLEDILKRYTIKIPEVQRNYVQGNRDEITRIIRQNLVFNLMNGQGNVDLFFIYGKVEESNNNFVPLDGQQRLTTLFLLYWYLSIIDDKEEAFFSIAYKADGRCSFQHETHPDNTCFLEHLLEMSKKHEEFRDSILKGTQSKPSEIIRNRYGFKVEWKTNPTIVGMLEMLDAFSIFKEKEDRRTYEHLNRIRFRFLDVQQLKNADEDLLFIKMNSTGRKLTPWELFKAEIIKRIKNETGKDSPELFSFLDNEYMDTCYELLLLSDRDMSPESDIIRLIPRIETIALNFMKTLIMIFLGGKGNEVQETEASLFETMNGAWGRFAQWLTKKMSALEECFSGGNEKTLSHERFTALATRLSAALCRADYNATKAYEMRVIASAFVTDIPSALPDWYFRVVYNLIYNSNPQDDKTAFNAMNGIMTMKNLSTLPSAGFLSTAIKEEYLKLRLLEVSEEWRNAIEKAEKIAYLDGSVAMIITAMRTNGIWKRIFTDVSNELSDIQLSEFESATDLISRILPNDNPGTLFAIERYMLANFPETANSNDYTINLHTAKGRDTSFKRLFLHDSPTAENERLAFHTICNSADDDLNRALGLPSGTIIAEAISEDEEEFARYMENTPHKPNVELWWYLFTRTPAYFQKEESAFFMYSDARIIRKHCNVLYPLCKKQINGIHSELCIEYLSSRLCLNEKNRVRTSTTGACPYLLISDGSINYAIIYTCGDYDFKEHINALRTELKLYSEADVFVDSNIEAYGINQGQSTSQVRMMLLKGKGDPIALDVYRIDEISQTLKQVFEKINTHDKQYIQPSKTNQ